MVGNKEDLDSQRVVSKQDGRKFADEHNIPIFYESSAKTGNNVPRIFEKMSEEMLQIYQDKEPDPDFYQPRKKSLKDVQRVLHNDPKTEKKGGCC